MFNNQFNQPNNPMNNPMLMQAMQMAQGKSSDQLKQLELQASLGNVVRYPSATTYTAGYSPCFNQGCGCDC